MTENHEIRPGGDDTDNEDRGQKRRRRRRKIGYIVGASVAAMIGVLGVGAIMTHGFHAGWHDGGFERFVDSRIDRILDRIDATDDQRSKVKPVLINASGEIRDLYLEMREGRKSLVAALTGQKVDRQSIETLRAASLASMDQASRRMLQALADAAEVLTPEQRAKIAEKIARYDHHHD